MSNPVECACHICGTILSSTTDTLCPRCARTDLDSMARRTCSNCGKEAHSIEDLDNFSKNINREYRRSNLCKSCTNKMASMRWMRGREQRIQTGLRREEEAWNRKKLLADRYLRLIGVWGYV